MSFLIFFNLFQIFITTFGMAFVLSVKRSNSIISCFCLMFFLSLFLKNTREFYYRYILYQWRTNSYSNELLSFYYRKASSKIYFCAGLMSHCLEMKPNEVKKFYEQIQGIK